MPRRRSVGLVLAFFVSCKGDSPNKYSARECFSHLFDDGSGFNVRINEVRGHTYLYESIYGSTSPRRWSHAICSEPFQKFETFWKHEPDCDRFLDALRACEEQERRGVTCKNMVCGNGP